MQEKKRSFGYAAEMNGYEVLATSFDSECSLVIFLTVSSSKPIVNS